MMNGPATMAMIKNHLNVNKNRLYINLENMIIAGDVEKKSFQSEGLNPLDYRTGGTVSGKSPKFFYVPTKRGKKKYEYYKEQGIYDEIDLNELREEWQRRKGIWD